ncbi:MAG: methionyl-tRNA formyltransferase [Candidatus Andersenbacteria bacterium]
MDPRIIFFGTPEFAVPSLEALIAAGYKPLAVVTQPAAPVGRHAKPTESAVARAAHKHAIPVQTPDSIKSKEFISWLREQKPDVALLVAYGKILPEPVLAVPKLGFVNVHPSLLPNYRGASPIAGALLNGETQTGVSIMRLDAQMDHGPILAQQTIDIASDATMGSLSKSLADLGATLLIKTLPDFLSGNNQGEPQDHSQATVTKLLKRSDGELDWSRSAIELERQVRAFTPWPGTFTYLGGVRLKILAAQIGADAPVDNASKPGALTLEGERLFIQTGAGQLEILRVQLAGKKPQNVGEFIHGQPRLRGATVG